MRHTRWIDLVFRLLPFPSWKGRLIVRHVEKCPECGARLASRDEARRILTQADEVGDLAGMWPAVRARIGSCAPAETAAPLFEPRLAPAWRWAAALGGLVLAAAVTFAVVENFRTGGGMKSGAGAGLFAVSDPADISLDYVRIDNHPARTLVFKPRDSRLVIVWAEKNQ